MRAVARPAGRSGRATRRQHYGHLPWAQGSGWRLPGVLPDLGRVEGWGVPSGTGNAQSVLLEYSQEAESATQLAPLPTTLIPRFPGCATVSHNHPHFNLRFSKSLLRAF